MTGYVAIVHHYHDATYDDRENVERQEIVGVVVQTDESVEDFNKRVDVTKDRLANETWRDRVDTNDETMIRLAASYIDNKVYSGYLETETLEILE